MASVTKLSMILRHLETRSIHSRDCGLMRYSPREDFEPVTGPLTDEDRAECTCLAIELARCMARAVDESAATAEGN